MAAGLLLPLCPGVGWVSGQLRMWRLSAAGSVWLWLGCLSSLWQGGGSFSSSAPALNRQVLHWIQERRGDGVRSFFFFFSCQTKRKKETVPSVSQKGRSCSGLQEEAGDPPVLRAGTTWGLTREMFSCLEHNCQWKSLSTDFSAQKHCGLGHFGEDF